MNILITGASRGIGAAAYALLGHEAPDFALKDQDGNDFRLSSQRGHWVLLFFIVVTGDHIA